MEKIWAFPLVVSSLVCAFLIVTTLNMSLFSSINSIFSLIPFGMSIDPLFLEAEATPTDPSTPRLAYLVSGSRGDSEHLWRTLLALYHPINQYIVHMDLKSSDQERRVLWDRIEKDPMFSKVGNVHMVTKANMVSYKGPTMVANTLHACAILLRKNKDWDWFINLSASDYPLVTQDDILYTFKDVPRNVNFVEHTSRLGWKENGRAKPLIIDPGLYPSQEKGIFFVKERRELPTAFKLFTGSAWMVLSRAFVEYCVWGWDNLPRTLLMYYTNVISSPEFYFHTVLCNTPDFACTVANHDLHFIAWDMPPKQHPKNLKLSDYGRMIASNAPFARKFEHNDPVLKKIDDELLKRKNGSYTPGSWCGGKPLCSKVAHNYRLNPGPGARRLSTLVNRITRSETFFKNQCK